ncbi:unnamed protein product [Rodentolepis nana]|uniref:Nucleotid_trans domain-containing protein n=1 Tax=Rodentolepis nana TaxID=102285 RepID=A0A0R3TZK2_RODNA|nr:unnamed protein product [Rodentolepis nana]
MLDGDIRDRDPTAINVMQIVIGSRAVRFHTLFLKSLIFHHFEIVGMAAAPIHLRLLTDDSTRRILEGVLGSWRINDLRYTFYPAEPYKVILFDTACLFMTDIENLWNYFYLFKPFQFLGVAPEAMENDFDLRRFGGKRHDFRYNDGLSMWYLQRLTMAKWNKIWQPSYHRALKMPKVLGEAEQVEYFQLFMMTLIV